MAYQVGISSGFWNIGKDPNLLGLVQKAAGFGATAGVTFNQIDLESMSEFLEPRIKENMRRVQRELGLRIGIHEEIGQQSALEVADRRIWDQAHQRLCDVVKNAAELKIDYVNFHLSSTQIISVNEAQVRLQGYLYQVVTPYGKPFYTLADASPRLKQYVMDSFRGVASILQNDPVWRKMAEDEYAKQTAEMQKRIQEITKIVESDPEFKKWPEHMKQQRMREIKESEEERRNRQWDRKVHSDREFLYEAWKRSSFVKFVLEAGEIDAYVFTAQYMKMNNDMLWAHIAGNRDPDDVYINDQCSFNAAVAAKYIEGHLTVKDNKWNKQKLGGKSVVEFAEKNNVKLCFEQPEAHGGGTEGTYRLFDPRHAQWIVRKIGSPAVKLCIDFEHMLSQGLDPYKVIPDLPGDFGKLVYLFHLGEPKPYWGTAHIPIPLGSQAQEILYEWLYMLRQKGFKDGILIFERGGGRTGSGRTTWEVFEQSVLSLRQIAENLEKNISPKELPLTFYGMSEKNEAVFKRELVAIRDHAWDPLEGVLSVPEEKHTFLSRGAIEKQKAQEWEKRKFR